MKFTGAVPFNDHWKFGKTMASGVERASFRDGEFTEVTLPHDWQISNRRDPEMEMGWSQGYRPRNEVGWYRKQFTAPKDWQGKSVLLIIDGCQRFYDVYLNEKRIGGHRYGYVPEVLELAEGLRCGEENLLCVRVDNAHTLGDRWYSGAGLYQGVRLLVKDQIHFRPWSLRVDYELRDGAAEVCLQVETDGAADTNRLQVEGCLRNPEGQSVTALSAPVENGKAYASFRVSSPRRWDLEDPALYELELRLIRNGEPLDTAIERIGFRESRFDPDRGYFLNGRNRKLYGANLHHDGGSVFGAVMPENMLRRRLRTLKEMGCNAIRCSHNPQAEILYDLCDEMGLAVIDELYDKWCDTNLYFDQIFEEDRFDDLNRLISRDRNHPSVILWSVGNEVEIQYTEKFYEKLKEMVEACHALDPSRPVSLALIGFCMRGYLDDETELKKKTNLVLRYAEIVDVFMGNYMEGYYSAFREAGMRKAIIGSEVFTYYRTEELSAYHTVARSPWADVRNRDYVAGGFVWAGVDYLGEAADYPSRGWTGCPVDSTGFRKLRSWFVESQWKDAPVLKLGFPDDQAYDDHARSNWGFPLMSARWQGRREDLMKQVCVMTNCEEVRLYLNGDPVRTCRTRGEDGMMHMLLPFRKGCVRAEGWTKGVKAAEQVLRSAGGYREIRISCEKPEEIREGEILIADICLTDEYGQLWEDSSPDFTVTLEGDAELIGLDNGDFMAPDRMREKNECSFHLGHAAAFIRIGAGGKAVLRVSCEGMTAERTLG